jgi:hypothetical protein
MRFRLRTLLIVLAIGPMMPALGCGKSRPTPVLPEAQSAALDHGQHFELLSLEPMARDVDDGDRFHNWKILGKAVIDDEGRETLVAALKKGVAEGGPVASCFEPRHGIHVEHQGHTYDFVICFKCLWGEAYVDGAAVNGALPLSRSPQPTFDNALRSAGVPLPTPPKIR